MKNIAIIPARSGSKGLQDKNIKLFNGKPLMAHTIEAARMSNKFDLIFVSTDSPEYASIAIEYGAKVPFLREIETSSDIASSWSVVEEVLMKLENLGHCFDTFALLQPTSPLRTGTDIIEAYSYMERKMAAYVIGVSETDHSPLWCNTLPEDCSLEGFITDEALGPRQKLSKYYRINGAIYLADISDFKKERKIYGEKSFAYIMDNYKSIDIDTELDFRIAEIIFRYQQEKCR